MMVLPHEMRFLYDSVVVHRLPDRMIPPSHRQYDVVSRLPRGPMDFLIGCFDIDFDGGTLYDTLGTNTHSITYKERRYFEHAAAYTVLHPSTPWPGFDLYDGQPAAHTRIDYVRVWDTPADVKIANYPQ